MSTTIASSVIRRLRAVLRRHLQLELTARHRIKALLQHPPRHLLRFIVLALVIHITPSLAHADVATQVGLKAIANSIGYLAAVIAFAGIAIATAINLGLKSRFHD